MRPQTDYIVLMALKSSRIVTEKWEVQTQSAILCLHWTNLCVHIYSFEAPSGGGATPPVSQQNKTYLPVVEIISERVKSIPATFCKLWSTAHYLISPLIHA